MNRKTIRTLILSVLSLMLFSSTALAGGGAPQTFKDFRSYTEYRLDVQDEYMETGEISPYFESYCHFYISEAFGPTFYYRIETKFHSEQTNRVTRLEVQIGLAKAQGNDTTKLETRLFKTKHKIDLMEEWHADMYTYQNWVWTQLHIYCGDIAE